MSPPTAISEWAFGRIAVHPKLNLESIIEIRHVRLSQDDKSSFIKCWNEANYLYTYELIQPDELEPSIPVVVKERRSIHKLQLVPRYDYVNVIKQSGRSIKAYRVSSTQLLDWIRTRFPDIKPT